MVKVKPSYLNKELMSRIELDVKLPLEAVTHDPRAKRKPMWLLRRSGATL